MVTMADAPAELEPAIMASAEPVEAQDQKKDADTEEGQPDFKERANAALHPEAAEETSTVKEGDLYIPKDTQIRLELVDLISSKRSKTGSTFKLKTMENTIINDVVVIPQGGRGQRYRGEGPWERDVRPRRQAGIQCALCSNH